MRRSSERRIRMAANLTHAEAERLLAAEKQRKLREKLNSTSKSQRFRTKWQKFCYEGPTARQDAESAERSRWINMLADILKTRTPQ